MFRNEEGAILDSGRSTHGRWLRRRLRQVIDRIEDAGHILRIEKTFGTLWGYCCEWGFVDAPRFDDAVLGEIVDDQVDERDLVSAVAVLVEEAYERCFGCLAVKTDE